MAAWRDSTGVQVKSIYIANHDDIQSKILAGGAEGTDLITYYQGYKPLYQDELGILSPIDESKVPNLAGLIPFFASDVGNFWVLPDGTRIGVPFTWGAGGMNYDTSVLPEPPASYFDVLTPEFKGRVTFPDDPVGAYSLGSVALGFDVAKLTTAEFDEVSEFLKKMVAQTKGIASSYGDMTTHIVAGEAWVAPLGWAAMNKFAAEAGKDTVQITLPKEGAAGFCDAWAIPNTADNPDTVHAWINETLEPETNAAAANGLAGGATVVGAEEFLDEDVLALYPYDDLDSFLAQVKFFENPPVESTEYVTYEQVVSTWQEVKLGA
jgi:spermidine/putrescine-binding protein